MTVKRNANSPVADGEGMVELLGDVCDRKLSNRIGLR
jgi:hypothetical protein